MLDDLSDLFTADAAASAAIAHFNATAAPFSDGLIDELIRAANLPSAALCCQSGDLVLDRGTFLHRAELLAGWLQAHGVGRGAIVGIVMEPSPARIMALYAAMRAGGVALPIDHALPDDRIDLYLRDSACTALLVDAGQAGRTWNGAVAAQLVLPPDGDAHLPPVAVWRDPARCAQDWCYIVYTSGTTGKPKAAINNHRALVNRLEWMARDIAITPLDQVCHKTPFGFDVSVWEQLLPLLTGAPVHITADSLRREPDALRAFFAKHRISISHFVPSQLGEFVAAAKASPPPGLRCIVASGEALPVATAQAVLAWPDVALHNYYGPSEAAIDVTGWSVAADLGHDVSIGSPIQNCTIRILDAQLAEVPVGAAGEIFIGGTPVGNGYLHAPRISAARFVPDPFTDQPGALLYRTGDIGLWDANGMVRFIGRNDRQLKLRGLRIEPGEIESRLVEATGQTQCLVEPIEMGSGQTVLIGFVVAPDPVDEDAVIARLTQSLPAYMVPARIITLERLPVSANGKADQRELHAIAGRTLRDTDETEECPLTPAAACLATIWTALLGLTVRSAGAHFFKLGGDSITAIRLVARVRAEGFKLETQDVFDHPVLSELALAMVPLDLAEVPLSAFAEAIRAATPSQRLALTPVLIVPAAWADAAMVSRAAELAAALRPDLAPAAALDLRDDQADHPALRIANTPGLAVAANRLADGAILIALDPASADEASIGPVMEWLRGNGPLPRIERHPLCDIVPELPQDCALAWPTKALQSVTIALPAAPDRWRNTASNERYLDWVTAQLLAVLTVHAPVPGLRARLPESRVPAHGAGISVDRPIGRLGSNSVWTSKSAPFAATIAAHRSQPSGERSDTASASPLVCFRITDIQCSGSAQHLAAPIVARGEVAVIWHPGGLHVQWPDAQAAWLKPALNELEGCDAADFAPSPDWLNSRVQGDFPLSVLNAAQLDSLIAAYGAIDDIYPLAPLQEGMLMRAAYWPESDAYLNQNIIELRGPLDPEHVTSAWSTICERYEILRSAYRWQDLAQPLAVIAEDLPQGVEYHDWSAVPVADFEQRITAFLDQDRAVPFDLARPGLWRLRLIRQAPDRHVLVWTHHHILLDGWCLALIWGDFAKAFAALAGTDASAVMPQPRPYRDYIAWLAAHPPGEATRTYWRDRLDGAEACAVSTGAPDEEGIAATVRVPLPSERKAALDRACATLGLTANAFIQAAWSLLIGLRRGTSDVTHGVSISGRPPEMAGSEAMVGLFINLIPLRVRADPHQTAADFLQSVQQGLAAANRHGTLALPEILSHWHGRANPDQRLFDSLIAFENYPDENLPTSSVAGVEFVDRFCDEKTEYPIGLIVLPGDPFEVHFNYDTKHFSDADMAVIRADYLGLLDRLIDQPDSTLATFELSSCAAVPVQCDQPPDAFPPVDLRDLLAPDPQCDALPALLGQGRTWTRAGLRLVVDQVGAQLTATTRQQVIAICAHRSADFAVAVLAAWRCGLVPIVINPALPDAVICEILQDCGDPLLLVDDLTAPRLGGQSGPALALADLIAQAETEPALPRTMAPAAQSAAMLLTSGTTGKPKPVIIPAAGFEHRVAWTRHLYALDHPRLLANAAPGFDIGLWELAWPLACGGSVVIADDDDVVDMSRLHSRMAAHAITALHATPTFASAFCDRPEPWPSLALLVTGGEQVTPERVHALARKAPRARIFQGYGPTEACVSVVDSALDAGVMAGPLALGRSMPGAVTYVLDSALRHCPEGAVGTIHIAGCPIGSGYWGRPGQTAAAFVPDPDGPPGTVRYNTGDRGYWSRSGQLHFAGRGDRQIKVRGFRVELDAVERALGSHPLVRQAAVISTIISGETELHGFAVPKPDSTGGGLSEPGLRNWLAKHLPRWAVPQRLTVTAALPQSSNGKVDYAALAAAPSAPASANAKALTLHPENDLERAIADCWESVIGQPPASRTVNFFEAGGHSMSAMRLVAQLQARLGLADGIRVPLFFKFPSVAGLAEALLTPGDTGCARHMTCLAEGTGTPLILIHPVEGLIHAYRPLARALSNQSVWAIEDPRFGGNDPFVDLHEMAELYVEWVRNHFDGERVMLGGWSFGGAVALEMAAIMARHDAPPGVVMIDSYNFAGCGNDPLAFSRSAIERLGQLDGIDPQTRQDLQQEILGNTCLALREGAGSYPHPVTLIQAAEQDPSVVAELGPRNGWMRRCGSVQALVVPGDHYSIMQEPGLAATAAAVRTALQQHAQKEALPA